MIKLGCDFLLPIIFHANNYNLPGYAGSAASQEILNENLDNISLDFKLADELIPVGDFLELEYENGGRFCRVFVGALDNWPAGELHLSTTVTFENPINDGSADYPAGTQVFDDSIYIKP